MSVRGEKDDTIDCVIASVSTLSIRPIDLPLATTSSLYWGSDISYYAIGCTV
ncbi:MAG: hypothetical protein WAO51_05850 [Bacillota bacterium]